MTPGIKQIALVADLHGNLPATLTLDQDLKARGIDDIYCLGDIVGKGPSSAETFDWAFSRCKVLVQGNWDSGIGFKQFPNDAFYYGQLGPDRLRKLREMPLEHSMTLSGRKIRLLHGRPVMRELLSPSAPPERLSWLFDPDYQAVAYADIHRQGLRMVENRGLLINTGAVGNGLSLTMVTTVAAQEAAFTSAVARYRTAKTASAKVEMVKHNKAMTKSTSSTGTLSMKDPDKVAIVCNGGKDQLVMNGNTFTMVMGGHKRVASAKTASQFAAFKAVLLSVLNCGKTDISKVQGVKVTTGGGNVIIKCHCTDCCIQR